jgi:benzoylformate decarboxylase
MRYAPDPVRLAHFAERIQKSKNPVLIYGPEIERSGGWKAGIKLAERLKAPVYLSPLSDRASFPQTHPLFAGMAPIAIGPLSKKLLGHDLIVVIGAQIFRYYPYIAGEYLPRGADLLQITSDPYDAAAAIVGDSLLSDAGLALDSLVDAISEVTSRTTRPSPAKATQATRKDPGSPLTALEAFTALGEVRPQNAILVNETASNFADLLQNWPIVEPDSYYTFASGALGWGAPAAVGIAIAQKKAGTHRPVVAAIGDGSLQYSVQSLHTAAQQKLKLIFIVPCNDEYAILKNFAVLENTPDVPGLDLPGLDIVATAKAFGCIGVAANTAQSIKKAFLAALRAEGPTVIAIRIASQMRRLVPDAI